MKEAFVAACEFCGQVVSADREFETQAAADVWATENCSCSKALEVRRIRARIADAKERVEQLFGEECRQYGFVPVEEPPVIELLEYAVELIAYGHVHSGAFQLRRYGKASISLTAKGRIRVQRSETKAYQLEE